MLTEYENIANEIIKAKIELKNKLVKTEEEINFKNIDLCKDDIIYIHINIFNNTYN